MLTVFWDMQRTITIDFLEKGATVNSASFCQPFGKIHLIYLLTSYEELDKTSFTYLLFGCHITISFMQSSWREENYYDQMQSVDKTKGGDM